jgi:zinc protease
MSTQPPPPTASRNIDYPEIPLTQLDNGLKVLCVEAHHLPRVTILAAIPGGRVSNPDDNYGLAQFTLETLKEGTDTRSSRVIAEQLDQLAIDFSTETYMEHSLLSMTLLESNLQAALELFADILLNPVFPGHELEKVKVRWHSHLVSERSDPGFLANERGFQELFAGHPYSRVSFPIDHLSQLDSDKAALFHRRRFTCHDGLLLLAGSLDLEEAARQSEVALGQWNAGFPTSQNFPELGHLKGPTVSLVHRPHSVQTKVWVGLRTLPHNDPEYIDLQMMNQVLGGGASARLFLNLREERGFTYGVYSSIRSYSLDGAQLISCSVRSDKTGETLQEIYREMRGMQENPPDSDELDRCKSEIVGSFIRRMETPSSIGSMELSRRLRQLPADYYRDFIPHVNSITEKAVSETAARFLRPERTSVVVVGDRSEIEDQLKPFGTVSVYDTDGQRID